MALQAVGTFWIYKRKRQSRVCVVVGRGSKSVREAGWKRPLSWNYHQVRFLDGLMPFTADIAEQDFNQHTKPVRPPQLDYWKRIYALKQQGLHIQQAVEQANAELAKGVIGIERSDGILVD